MYNWAAEFITNFMRIIERIGKGEGLRELIICLISGAALLLATNLVIANLGVIIGEGAPKGSTTLLIAGIIGIIAFIPPTWMSFYSLLHGTQTQTDDEILANAMRETSERVIIQQARANAPSHPQAKPDPQPEDQ